MDSQPREQLLPDGSEAEEAPDPNRSPILDPRNRSPLLPPLRETADNQPDQPEDADLQPAMKYFLQAGLELGKINDRLKVVEQEIAELKEFIDQHPEMVAFEAETARLDDLRWDALRRPHHHDLEVAVAKHNLDHEKRRDRQYQDDTRRQAGVQTREAADQIFWKRLDTPGGPEKEALRQEEERLRAQAHDEVEAAIEADPGARQARQRRRQADSHFDRVRDESPRLSGLRQQLSTRYKEKRELEERIWAENPDRAAAAQALREEKRELWSRQREARDHLDQAIEGLGEQPQPPPETEDQDPSLVSHG